MLTSGPFGQNRGVSRRDALLSGIATAAVAGGASSAVGSEGNSGENSPESTVSDDRRQSSKEYSFRKSINLWSFPYPDRMTLRECMQLAKRAGFDAIELNYDLENDLSPQASTNQLAAIRHMADEVGIEISGLCSFLFWPYPLSSNDPAKRERGIELAGLMAEAASQMGVENLLVVPGAVHIPWRDDHEPVANDVCLRRAKDAVGKLVRQAESSGVSLNMENIFFNGFLMTPMEMNQFVDGFGSEAVQVH